MWTNVEEATEFFKNDRFAMKTVGATIEDVKDHYAKCSLKINEDLLNAAGSVMGGAIFTLADFVFAVCANNKDEKAVTQTSTISYLSKAKGNILYGESRLIKNGKTSCVYEITITDNTGAVIALVVSNGIKLN